ncbi:hypothetical protein BpHYR1_040299, partial [Brachionus plicatilis]
CQIANFMENIYSFDGPYNCLLTVYAGPGPSFGRTRSATEIHKILIIQTVDQKRGWDYLRFGPNLVENSLTDIVAMNSISSLKTIDTVYSSSSLKNNFCLFEDKLFRDN